MNYYLRPQYEDRKKSLRVQREHKSCWVMRSPWSGKSVLWTIVQKIGWFQKPIINNKYWTNLFTSTLRSPCKYHCSEEQRTLKIRQASAPEEADWFGQRSPIPSSDENALSRWVYQHWTGWWNPPPPNKKNQGYRTHPTKRQFCLVNSTKQLCRIGIGSYQAAITPWKINQSQIN